jgi:hypothetical protein
MFSIPREHEPGTWNSECWTRFSQSPFRRGPRSDRACFRDLSRRRGIHPTAPRAAADETEGRTYECAAAHGIRRRAHAANPRRRDRT